MKSCKQLFRFVIASMMLSVMSLSAANAALIKQDIFLDFGTSLFAIGSIEIKVGESALALGGYADNLLDDVSLVELNFFGATVFNIFQFEVGIDTSNLAAGIEVLFFDVQELFASDNWSYNMAFDAFNGPNVIDIFNEAEQFVGFYDVVLGQATVTDVPAPGAVALLALAGLVVVARRRAQQK